MSFRIAEAPSYLVAKLGQHLELSPAKFFRFLFGIRSRLDISSHPPSTTGFIFQKAEIPNLIDGVNRR